MQWTDLVYNAREKGVVLLSYERKNRFGRDHEHTVQCKSYGVIYSVSCGHCIYTLQMDSL